MKIIKLLIICLVLVSSSCKKNNINLEYIQNLESHLISFSKKTDDEIYTDLNQKKLIKIFGPLVKNNNVIAMCIYAPDWKVVSQGNKWSHIRVNYPELNIGDSQPKGFPVKTFKNENNFYPRYQVNGKTYKNIDVHTSKVNTQRGIIYYGIAIQRK